LYFRYTNFNNILYGLYVSESGECLQLARKNRCPNLLAAERPGSSRVSRHRGHLHGRCAVTFLPLVRTTSASQQQQQIGSGGDWDQRLLCRDDVPGFLSTCPALRDFNSTKHVECDPLRLNTHRCDTTHAAVRTRCRLFQTCDHVSIHPLFSHNMHNYNIIEQETLWKN
jgi:hypothetical protein